VCSAHNIRTRKWGAGWYVDMHVHVAPEMTVKEGHDIASKVKRELLMQGLDIIDVIVHIEPADAY